MRIDISCICHPRQMANVIEIALIQPVEVNLIEINAAFLLLSLYYCMRLRYPNLTEIVDGLMRLRADTESNVSVGCANNWTLITKFDGKINGPVSAKALIRRVCIIRTKLENMRYKFVGRWRSINVDIANPQHKTYSLPILRGRICNAESLFPSLLWRRIH